MNRTNTSEPAMATIGRGVISVSDLRAAGVSRFAIDIRCRRGSWQQPLPGVVLLRGQPPTRGQLLRAAALYAGAGAMITGIDALAAAGLAPGGTDAIHLLVPARRRRANPGFLRFERTTRPPEPVHIDGIPFAPAIRAALDAARHISDRHALVMLLAPLICRGTCGINQLREELAAGSQRGSATVRGVLTELDPPPRSLTEQRAERIVAASGLPKPRWRVPLRDRHGRLLCAVGAWWDGVGLAWDFDDDRQGRHDALPAPGPGVLTAHRAMRLRTPA
ncbi:MAG: hypothetical protein ACRDRN_04015, partial [Sciscionella sp.]